MSNQITFIRFADFQFSVEIYGIIKSALSNILTNVSYHYILFFYDKCNIFLPHIFVRTFEPGKLWLPSAIYRCVHAF